MKRASYLVVIVAVAVILSVCLSQTLGKSGNPCISCHSTFYQYLDILEGDDRNQIPTTVKVGETRNVTVVVQNLCNAFMYTSLSNVSVALQSQNGRFAVENPTFAIGDFPVGEKTVTWMISGVSAGEDTFLITVQGINVHNRLSFSDSYSPAPPVTIFQGAPAVSLSKAQLFFTLGESKSETFEVIAESAARNITIAASPSLNGAINITSPRSIASIKAEANLTVSLYFNGSHSLVNNGTIGVAWVDLNGMPDSASVSVIMTEPSPASADAELLRWAGRITGFANIGLVSLSIGLGRVKMRKKRKVRLHCIVSWFLLALCVFHGFVLLVGPYSGAGLGQNVIVGYASVVTLGVSSVIGLLGKQMTKAAGHAVWLWTHRLFLIAGTVLGVSHGILTGTDFAFIRNMLGV